MRRDVHTLRARVKDEGDSFITITLPNFCRDFERSLDEGRIGPGRFLSFRKLPSGIPAFLQGFLSNVFDSEGILLANPSIDCIRFVRQICLFGKKILRPCSSKRDASAVEEYAKCDAGLADLHKDQLYRYLRMVSDIIVRDLDLGRDTLVSLMPQHGPGATYERIRGNAKWRFTRWTRRLEDVGATRLLFVRASGTEPNELEPPLPELCEPGDESPVRVTLVPKTLKSPRIIAVEPVHMQYMQQGLSRELVRQLSRCRFTAGHVNFRDQSVNQALALDGSKNGYLATLDMSEASDRVSLEHFEVCFESSPDFRDWALACRSERAELPTGEILTLRKFASMGSALCFPVESLVFFMSIVAIRLRRAGRFPTPRNVYSSGRGVYVYGDDLIVPADEAPAICDDLEALGFKVNRHKSFWTGKFRESCGSDCYDGEQVTPVYLRRDLPTSRKDISGLLSCVATANQLEEGGYSATAKALKDAVAVHLGLLPKVPHDSPAIGWHHHSEVMPRRRFNRDLQRWEHLQWVAVAPEVSDPLDGDAALAKCFRLLDRKTNPLSPPKISEDHLEKSPRPYGLALRRRWVPFP